MRPPATLAVFFAALLVLSLPFAVLDVGAMTSETTVEAGAVTDRVNDSPARFEEGLYLHVRGDGPRDRVERALVGAFAARGVEVTVVDTLERQYDGNVLVVTLGASESAYTPFRASANSTWAYFYTTTGNTSTLDEERRVVVIREGDDTSRFYFQIGELTMRDETEGTFTRAAYDRHVVEASAEALVTYTMTGRTA